MWKGIFPMEGHAHFARKYRLSVEVTIKALNLLVISVIEILTILFEEIENIAIFLHALSFLALNTYHFECQYCSTRRFFNGELKPVSV